MNCTECGKEANALFVGASGHRRCEECYGKANPAVTGRRVKGAERPRVENTLKYDDYFLQAKIDAYFEKDK